MQSVQQLLWLLGVCSVVVVEGGLYDSPADRASITVLTSANFDHTVYEVFAFAPYLTGYPPPTPVVLA
jgi:hypothetical protein